MESDVHPIGLSGVNLIFKYEDDTNLSFPENIDVGLKEKYEHIEH
jgi:hypothetical protein